MLLIMINLIMITFCLMVTGAVTISPSGISFRVCDGDQLELMCIISDPGSNLEWTIAPATIFTGQSRAIDAQGDQLQTLSFIINSTKFTFSRISTKDEFPLVSRLLISPVTTGLNETAVNCKDVIAMETVSAIFYVFNRPSDSTSCYSLAR